MEIFELLKGEGYENLIQTQHYGIIGLKRFMFTWGLVIDLDEMSYNRRYCYPSKELAELGLKQFLGFDKLSNERPIDPIDPWWIKRKGMFPEIVNPNNSKYETSS